MSSMLARLFQDYTRVQKHSVRWRNPSSEACAHASQPHPFKHHRTMPSSNKLDGDGLLLPKCN
eukprot:7396819-Pyramimonas_sp.AAC.1